MPPNILLIVTDQQRAGTIAPDSACRTPTLDGMAEDGVRFSRCYAQNSICSPSRASLLTGTLPHTHGMVDNTHCNPEYIARFRSDLDTWSRALSRNGYYLGYAGKWHVERSEALGEFGFDEQICLGEIVPDGPGIHEYDRSLPEGPAEADTDLYLPPGAPELEETDLTRAYVQRHEGYTDALTYGTYDGSPSDDTDHSIFAHGVDFVRDRAGSDDPWGLVVSPINPHDPFIAPDSYFDEYEDEGIELPDSFDDSLTDKPDIYARQARANEEMSRDQFREALRCYYASCTFLDDQVERLLAALRDTDQLTDTIVVFTSDHGELLGSHRLMAKGAPAFEESYNVPLIITDYTDSVDSPSGGDSCERVVSLYDLAPTIAEWGGGTLDGGSAESLVPLLEGDDSAHTDEAYAEFHSSRFSMTQRIVWSDQYKYVFHGAAEDELYDLDRDPAERDNLLSGPGSEHEETAKELAARMWEICRDTGDDALTNSNYHTCRIAPVGPESDGVGD